MTPVEHRRAAIQAAASVLRQHMPTAAEARLIEAATDVYTAIVADMRRAWAEEIAQHFETHYPDAQVSNVDAAQTIREIGGIA